jgi:hypothetical protein
VDAPAHVVFVLEVLIALGPLAVYFLGLGLVNSQPRPCMINARADFVWLTVAFLPVIAVPSVAMVQQGLLLAAVAVAGVVAVLFFVLLPARRSGWVLYNMEEQRCRRLIARACRRLGWTLIDDGDQQEVQEAGLSISYSAIPWLRNVAVRIETERRAETARHTLVRAIGEELVREPMLPSATGASLVVIGAGLLGVPMWYLFRHMDAIVEVARQIFKA